MGCGKCGKKKSKCRCKIIICKTKYDKKKKCKKNKCKKNKCSSSYYSSSSSCDPCGNKTNISAVLQTNVVQTLLANGANNLIFNNVNPITNNITSDGFGNIYLAKKGNYNLNISIYFNAVVNTVIGVYVNNALVQQFPINTNIFSVATSLNNLYSNSIVNIRNIGGVNATLISPGIGASVYIQKV